MWLCTWHTLFQLSRKKLHMFCNYSVNDAQSSKTVKRSLKVRVVYDWFQSDHRLTILHPMHCNETKLLMMAVYREMHAGLSLDATADIGLSLDVKTDVWPLPKDIAKKCLWHLLVFLWIFLLRTQKWMYVYTELPLTIEYIVFFLAFENRVVTVRSGWSCL